MTEAEQVWSDEEEEPEPCALAYSEACKEASSVPCGRWLRTCQSRGEECQLQHYGIGKKGAPALGASLRVNVCMRALDLSDNGLGSAGVRSLVDALLGGGAPALIILDLSQNQAGPDGAAALGELLAEQTKSESGLQTLRFDANAIGDKGAGQLASGLTTNRALRALHLCRNEVGCEGAGQMAPALAQNATLENLSLEWNQIRADGCRALLGACRDAAVTQLDLGWNGVRDEACAAIAAALRDGSAQLRELKLHHNHVSAEGGAALCAALGALDALDVSGNPLANEGVCALLLAHHALPADKPCRLRMEEVCVRPGSNLPMLLAKVSEGHPLEMQARSSPAVTHTAPARHLHATPHATLRHSVRACPLLPRCCPSAHPRHTLSAPSPPPLRTSPPTRSQDLEEAGVPVAAARAMSKVAALDKKSKSAANKSKHGKPKKSVPIAAAAAAPSAAPAAAKPAAAKPLPFDTPGATEGTGKPYMDPGNLKIR